MPQNMAHEKAQIPTNLRLLLLLEEVSRAGVPVTPADLTDALGLPKPTVHRLFNTAEEAGFLQRDIDGRSYGPGPRLRRL
jgi:IclR family acetate operon transcriptional repressor